MNYQNHQEQIFKRQKGLTLIEIMVAIIIIGISIGVFLKLRASSGSRLAGNSKMMLAGHLIQKNIEEMRINIAKDSVANWPPRDTNFTEGPLKLDRKILPAKSPIDTNLVLPNARKVNIIASWGNGPLDSLNITTYITPKY